MRRSRADRRCCPSPVRRPEPSTFPCAARVPFPTPAEQPAYARCALCATVAIAKLLSASDLPEPPPTDPLPLLAAWFEQRVSSGKYDDPTRRARRHPGGRSRAGWRRRRRLRRERGRRRSTRTTTAARGVSWRRIRGVAGVFHWPHARGSGIEGVAERMTPGRATSIFAADRSCRGWGVCEPPEHGDRLAGGTGGCAPPARPRPPGHSIARPAYWGGFWITLTAVELARVTRGGCTSA